MIFKFQNSCFPQRKIYIFLCVCIVLLYVFQRCDGDHILLCSMLPYIYICFEIHWSFWFCLFLTEFCLSCGKTRVATFHPLFEGGLCQTCKVLEEEDFKIIDQNLTSSKVVWCALGSFCVTDEMNNDFVFRGWTPMVQGEFWAEIKIQFSTSMAHR